MPRFELSFPECEFNANLSLVQGQITLNQSNKYLVLFHVIARCLNLRHYPKFNTITYKRKFT